MMPIFMDMHVSPTGEISIDELVKKHRADLAVQHKYGIEFKGMWVNKEKGMVFCLMEGPDKAACISVHQEAHGDEGCNVIEVSPGDYDKFLAPSFTNEHDIAETEKNRLDSGYRTILRFEMLDLIQKIQFGVTYIQPFVKKHKGELLPEPGQAIKAVFIDSADAFQCTVHIADYLDRKTSSPAYRMAVISGKPVEESHDQFFGYTLDLSEKLMKCYFVKPIQTTKLSIDLLKNETGGTGLSFDKMAVLAKADEKSLYRLIDAIEQNVGETDFNTNGLAKKAHLSRSQLFRKVKKLTGHTPNTLIREVRLYEALKHMRREPDLIAQIAYDTGFNSPSYFSKLFKQRFNILPSECIEALHN